MVEIVKQLGWTYVSTVAAQGEYGEKVKLQTLAWIFKYFIQFPLPIVEPQFK